MYQGALEFAVDEVDLVIFLFIKSSKQQLGKLTRLIEIRVVPNIRITVVDRISTPFTVLPDSAPEHDQGKFRCVFRCRCLLQHMVKIAVQVAVKATAQAAVRTNYHIADMAYFCLFLQIRMRDRAADLQEQAGGPPLNPIEMGSKDWDEIVARLAADAELTAKFRAVYPDGWSGKNITNAIAEYEKTLISPDSRFDRWLRGDKSALTAAEVGGYERFKAYRCASCHVGKSMGGQSYEYLDLKKDYFADRGGKPLGSDKGRFNASGKEEDMHRFKVPNLRNVELTHPYLHDGTVTTLDEAVRIMGIYCSGLDVPQKDRALIVGFLRTLTGQHEGRPVQGEAMAR